MITIIIILRESEDFILHFTGAGDITIRSLPIFTGIRITHGTGVSAYTPDAHI